MKKLLIFSVFVFTLLSCKQNIQNSASEINITVKVDAGIKLKDDKPIKAKKGALWKELKTIADSKIETKKEYTFKEWKLKDEKGKALSADYAFNQDEVVYAVSVLAQKNARITIKGDERLSIIGDDFININIFVPKTFKDVEDKIKAKLSLKPEWNNGDYDIFDWKLNDENGELILGDTLITETMTIFARTNYVKFRIEDTTISSYTGEEPRGRIIIPKEITRVMGLSSCRELISVDLSLCKELTELVLCYTGITGIDLSNNTKLTKLNLENTGITSIDVSKNEKLALLDLENTGITSIDVSKNEKLTGLDLRDTKITSIDVSKNEKLTKLWLEDTGITSIDVSKNEKLALLNLENTGITSIDVSKNTELVELYLRGSKITSIDVSKNTELVELYLHGTKITSIDVSNNTKLHKLGLGRTGITSIDVSKNTELTILSLGYTGITSIDVSKNEKLTWLNLVNTGITSIDVSKNTELVELYLYDTGIASIDVSKNTKLKYVYFTNCSNLTAIDLSACTDLDTIPNGLCFSGLVNAVVTLPSSIKIIGKASFGVADYNYCKKVIVPNNEIKQLLLGSGYPEARIEVKS